MANNLAMTAVRISQISAAQNKRGKDCFARLPRRTRTVGYGGREKQVPQQHHRPKKTCEHTMEEKSFDSPLRENARGVLRVRVRVCACLRVLVSLKINEVRRRHAKAVRSSSQARAKKPAVSRWRCHRLSVASSRLRRKAGWRAARLRGSRTWAGTRTGCTSRSSTSRRRA